MEELNLVYFILMALATWRMTSLLMKENGPFNMFVLIRRIVGIKHYDDGSVLSYKDNFFGRLFECSWCLSVWVGAGLTVAYIFLPEITIYFALALSLSTITILIEERM